MDYSNDKAFVQLIENVLQAEGGYVNDPKDSGGETIWGITIGVARAFGYKDQMKEMTREQAKQIYFEKYWLMLFLHEIAPLSLVIAEELLDTGVNQGTGAAAKYLQRSLNVLNLNETMYPDTKIDGAIGKMTVAALREYLAKRKARGETVLHRMLNSLQGAGYVELAERRSKDEAYVYGWFLNRVVL